MIFRRFKGVVWAGVGTVLLGAMMAGGVGADDGAAGGGVYREHCVGVAQLRTQYFQALEKLRDRLVWEGEWAAALDVHREWLRFRRHHEAPEVEGLRTFPQLAALARIYLDEGARMDAHVGESLASGGPGF